ncbi:MAG: hypothetical protein EPO09_20400 [Aquabacterium sp.]|uniref:hypothetical protein n=1 Tax=Aquabacterium sp. TaxID=1872578 RepID=UPI0012186939|nr:hypothetical protein [Aquabacterium sp.]TAK85241.1 MAG: hypothetical protein EPO09_20400 [Aquabacterium sp.]
MKKFENRPETGYFVIDPAHLAAGLAAAATKKLTAIRVSPLDSRSKNLSFDPSALIGQTWIRKLVLDEGLTPDPAALVSIQALADLQELSMPQWIRLDFSAFTRLETLVLSKGDALDGLDKITSLKMLYLIDWQTEALPKELAGISASEVRISASRKLCQIDKLFKCEALRDLTLQDLPKLEVPAKALKLNTLERLNVEKIGWKDFAFLSSKSLLDLELFTTFESLGFIKQLPALKRLYIWECVDGDMNPVLAHAALEEFYVDKNRKHYTHKESQLQSALQARS